MTPVEALQMALSKETASIQLYEKFSIEHPALKELFIDLMNEEYKHKKLIEKRIAEETKY